MRILCVDPGRRHVGLASCDELEIAVRPLKAIERRGNARLAAAIVREAIKEEADEIVIGHPLNMNGTPGPSAKDAEKIAALIAEKAGTPVRLWDERLSSWEAENLMKELKIPEKKRKILAHSASAAVILRSYLDSRKGG
jgi:putative Holliday junction resolvase